LGNCHLLVTLFGAIFWRLATCFAGYTSFLTHLIKSLFNASGGVIDSLLSRETRRFVLLSGRIKGLVLGFGLLIDDRHLAINLTTIACLAMFLRLLLNPFLHLNTIGFNLLLAGVAPLHAIGDGLLLLVLFSFVGCSNLLVDLGHFNFDIHIVIE
jgi:hypothetical protein